MALLQEANEELIVSALDARDLLCAAERAALNQAQTMTMVAHELRNPLQTILSAAALLGRKDAQTPGSHALARGIDRQVKQISRLIEGLLDVGRMKAGRLDVELRPVNLVEVIDLAVESCRSSLDSRLQALTVRVPAGRVEIHADSDRIVQIICNLLGNASKYTPRQGAIELSLAIAGSDAVIRVSDTGIGILAAALPTIFEPFVRDAHATQFDSKGLGIGLAVVYHLVTAHGGTVKATSPGVNLGSQFVLNLPLGAPAAGTDGAKSLGI